MIYMIYLCLTSETLLLQWHISQQHTTSSDQILVDSVTVGQPFFWCKLAKLLCEVMWWFTPGEDAALTVLHVLKCENLIQKKTNKPCYLAVQGSLKPLAQQTGFAGAGAILGSSLVCLVTRSWNARQGTQIWLGSLGFRLLFSLFLAPVCLGRKHSCLERFELCWT